jgi:hypothetical protein
MEVSVESALMKKSLRLKIITLPLAAAMAQADI